MNKILARILILFYYLVVIAAVCIGLLYLLSANLIYFLLGIVIAIILISAFESIAKKKMNFWIIILPSLTLLAAYFMTPMFYNPFSSFAAADATIKSYLGQLKRVSANYYDNNNYSYVGLDQNGEYVATEERLVGAYERQRSKNYYSSQISEKNYCAKAKLFSKDAHYWCVDNKGYDGAATDQYCTVEKPYCAE